MKKNCPPFVLVALGFAAVMSPLRGESQVGATHTESILLQTDALIFADVTSLRALPESNLVQVGLANASAVHSRWAEVPESFRVVGRVAAGVVEFGHYRRLEEGRRYLFFLRGGRWFSSPLIDFGIPLYPVSEDGTVLCAGGAVYGVGRYGLACSTTERQAGVPLSEQDLTRLLRSARRRAVVHRPAQAAEEDSAGRELRLQPVFR